MQHVERAIFDLRRGMPVAIEDSGQFYLIAPLEGLDDTLLAQMLAGADGDARLLLTEHRLARLEQTVAIPAASLPVTPADGRRELIAWACAPDARWPAGRTPRPPAPAELAISNLMRRSLLIPAALVITPNAERAHELTRLIEARELLCLSQDDMTQHKAETYSLLHRVSEAEVPLAEAARSRFVVFRESDGLREHVAILIGDEARWPDPLPVRLHSACLTGDLFGSLRCDCGPQLQASVANIAERGGGVLLYLAQEGRGIGLANKMRAYQMQDEGLDTVDADQVLGFGKDEREYSVAREMLAQLAITHIELLTNNPAKLDAMNQPPIRVAGRHPIYGELTDQNRRYLSTKATRAGHWLDAILDEGPSTPAK